MDCFCMREVSIIAYRATKIYVSEFKATGRDIDGGYAEYMKVRADFVHPIPDSLFRFRSRADCCVRAQLDIGHCD